MYLGQVTICKHLGLGTLGLLMKVVKLPQLYFLDEYFSMLLLPHIESPRLLPEALNIISLFIPISPLQEPKPPAQTHRPPNTPPSLHTSVSASELAGTSLGRSSWTVKQGPGKQYNFLFHWVVTNVVSLTSQ